MLSNWLNPVDLDVVSSHFSNTFDNIKSFPDLESAKVVVFSRDRIITNTVRLALSKLPNHYDLKIVDIGDLGPENITSAYQVISELQDGMIIPILIGVDNMSSKEICKALTKESKLYHHSFISNTCHVESEGYSIDNIGFQRHILPKHIFSNLMISNRSGLSLGAFRTHSDVIEPLLRETNYVHIDLAAVRKGDCPNCKDSLPTGLEAEELCQIARFVGEGNQLKLISFNTSNLDHSNHENEAMLIAQFIWYFQEGLAVNPEEHPAISDNFREYIIQLNEIDHNLVFKQSKKSGKWWIQSSENKNKYISCAYEEYKATINQELPDRLLKII